MRSKLRYSGTETKSAKGLWQYTVGARPNTLVAEEREDRGLKVYFRWQVPAVDKNGKPVSRATYCATGLTVRDGRGREVEKLKQKAREASEKAQAIYASGGDPRNWNDPKKDGESVPRTLAEGFKQALPDRRNPKHVGTLYPYVTRRPYISGPAPTTSNAFSAGPMSGAS